MAEARKPTHPLWGSQSGTSPNLLKILRGIGSFAAML
jgi:hypothetical protein